MFDANAAHIKCGEKFFAEVHSTSEQIESFGIKAGDIILCEHVEKSGERPRENTHSKIWTSKDSSSFDYYIDVNDQWSWLVYSGRPDGTGFIDDKWKLKAMDFLVKKWELDNA